MPTNLGAELSPAQNSAIHDSLSHTPYHQYRAPWQLTGPMFRQSSCFLPCSPGPRALPGHSPTTRQMAPLNTNTEGQLFGLTPMV